MPPESTDKPPPTPTAISVIPSRAELETLTEIANAMIEARIPLPPGCTTPQALLMKFLFGRELGLSPMVSLHEIDLIKGRAGMNARTQVAMIRRRGLGNVRLLRQTDTEAAVEAWRIDDPDVKKFEFIFTMDDAKRAGLTERDTWRKYPKSMLLARAISLATHALFQDVFLGVACTPEELGADVNENGGLEFIDVSATSGVQMKPVATMTPNEAATIAEQQTAKLAQAPDDDVSRAEVAASIKHMVREVLQIPKADWAHLRNRWKPSDRKMTAAELIPLGDHLQNLVLLKWMRETLGIPNDKWQKAIEKRGATNLYGLGAEEAAEFEAKLAEMVTPFKHGELLTRLLKQVAKLAESPAEDTAGNVSPPASQAS